MVRYYLDACIWRDYYENRFGTGGRPLGDYATRLFAEIIRKKHQVLLSDIILKELRRFFPEKDILEMFNILFYLNCLTRIDTDKKEFDDAKALSAGRGVPLADSLHAILARNNEAILVTQDNHFSSLADIVPVKRPEDLV